jgi:radical SAM protein with 4Fe4S-binding SPASM domain
MDCPSIPDLKYNDFSARLRKRIGNQRMPLSGSLELNYRCNLRCQHCYVAHGHTGLPGKQELTTAEIARILGEASDAGCLWLLLTGGEPLMRKDFKEIYLEAKRRGLLITLFTNGTMLTPEMADFLAEYRPFNLEITLYGFTQETYEKVTGIPGSHRRCYQGIELLMERQIILGLKTVVMTLNLHEFDQMKAYAESLGVAFRHDGMINSGFDFGSQVSCRPLSLRVPVQELIQLEACAPDFHIYWQKVLRSRQEIEQESTLYHCGAGLSSFHIDPYGELSLCLMSRLHTYSLRQGSFRQGWDEFLYQQRFQPALAERPCASCSLQPVCTQCPAWSEVEHGNSYQRVPFLCEMAQARSEKLGFTRLADPPFSGQPLIPLENIVELSQQGV